MNRQWRGILILGTLFVVAFVVTLAFHSLVGAVIVLLTAITVSFVLGISWMRTAPTHRTRGKEADVR